MIPDEIERFLSMPGMGRDARAFVEQHFGVESSKATIDVEAIEHVEPTRERSAVLTEPVLLLLVKMAGTVVEAIAVEWQPDDTALLSEDAIAELAELAGLPLAHVAIERWIG